MSNGQVVLIVDDERVNREIVKNILKDTYVIKEASDGQSAWDIISQNRETISAILLDLVMPIMDGYELLAKLTSEGITDLPVIVTTGNSDDESEQRVLEAGAWDYVTKPYNAKVLYTRLRNAIARSQVITYEKMQHMSEHDSLTGLHNREKMFSNTRKMIDKNPDKQFIFVRVDIDHFALFNTSFGEEEGNRLLRVFADCIREVAEIYSLCTYGRMNGDVFCACLAYDGDRDKLLGEGELIQKRLTEYRKDYQLEISAGVYIIDEPELSVDEFYLRSAIAAQKCKDQYETHLAFYDAEAGKRLSSEINIIKEIQTALDERQFVVYLQPKFNLSTEHACGAEALVRWKHPIKGLVSPGEFIPVFEKNGFISKLDYYVWEETCRMLRDWCATGRLPSPVSVNISRISLYNPELTSLMTNLVKKYNIAPSLLQLEVTESAYMTNPDLLKETIHSLHEAGFTILMDDFGSGYSSLNTLKEIEVDVLKVDMKFLPVMEETGRAEIILACVIKMANWLGMSVVVEGVETRRQRDFLEGAGCDCVQGFYYSRPIPQDEYEKKYVYNEDSAPNVANKITANDVVPQHNVTILVIDDSEMDRTILKENLQDLYYIVTCENAEEGLAYLKHNMSKVRLILVDNVMDGMSGMEFLKYCQENNALSAIPKIMITADSSTEDQVEAFRAGAFDYITKPFIKEVILARVNHVMTISRESSIFDSVAKVYENKSEIDSMTKLLNKMAFNDLSSRVIASTQEAMEALLVIDIDNFKEINDVYGHLAGDSVIRHVAEELTCAFRKTDVIGRFGGDEFVVLMTKVQNHDIAKRKAGEIIKGITLDCAKELHINVSVSIGVAFSDSNDTMDTLFARADQALYEAKRTGKGKIIVYGEKVPPVLDDLKPIILICGSDSQIYPAIALSYGEDAAFLSITSYRELQQAFHKYSERISVICLDMQKKIAGDSEEFYQYILRHGGGETMPIIAVCKEGHMEQVREALELKIFGVIYLPPQIDAIQRVVSRALMEADVI